MHASRTEALRPSSSFRWWLATSTDEPSVLLSYKDAQKKHLLRIVGESDHFGFINQVFSVVVSEDDRARTPMINLHGEMTPLYQENQITPGIEHIRHYLFTSENGKIVTTFDNLKFDDDTRFGKLNKRLVIEGEPKPYVDNEVEVFHLVNLDSYGTCLAICLMSGNRRYYILEEPEGHKEPITPKRPTVTHKTARRSAVISQPQKSGSRVATAVGAY